MSPETDRDAILADALEDFHRRRARGEVPRAEDYRRRLGDSHPEFQAILEAETLIDAALAPPTSDPLPRPFGAYTLLRELGRGAAGVVYEAVHRDLGRTVALKVLRTGFDTDRTALERFRREARACAHVRHPHIVAIYEVGDVDGRPFYAMDYVAGETLAARAKRGPAQDPLALCRSLAGIADALQALHDAKIVHRDVKPSNVMVRPDGSMMLADFGLARSAEAATLTRTGDALGTPLYMSPEQILGERAEVDARTDVYGLGATFYEALTGRPVFEADEMAALMKLIISQRPVPPRAASHSIPESCERIALKCLEKRKADRYPTAHALGEDLRAAADGRAVAGRPVGGVVRSLRAVRRHWLPVAAAAAVVVAAAAWATLRGATLHVEAPRLFGSDVAFYLDNKPVGMLSPGKPLTISVPRGDHVLEASRDGWSRWTDSRHFSPGSDVTVQPWLDPASEAAWAEFNQRVAKAPEEVKAISVHRGDSLTDFVQPIFPRGDVLVSDLDAFAMQVDIDKYSGPGRIEFRRGTEVLGAIDAFDPPNKNTWDAIPASVRASVRAGDVVTWGWIPGAGRSDAKTVRPALAEFRVVKRPGDLDARLAAVDAVFGKRTGHERELRRIEVFRALGLDTAAFREAYAFARSDPALERTPGGFLAAKDVSQSEYRKAWYAIWKLLDKKTDAKAWGLEATELHLDVASWLTLGETTGARHSLAPSLEPPLKKASPAPAK
jgi:hypothetical protein